MRTAATRPLIAAVLWIIAAGCGRDDCGSRDCAQVIYRWPCPGCGRPILVGTGATAIFTVGWSRAHNAGPFCPSAPRAVSSDATVLAAQIALDCGRELRVSGVMRGEARVDLFDGDVRLGGWEVGVSDIDHLAIVEAGAGPTARQDPEMRRATLGVPLELVAYAYDGEGHSLFADPEPISWSSDEPAVLAIEDPFSGRFAPRAEGTTTVRVMLAGATGSATVLVVAP